MTDVPGGDQGDGGATGGSPKHVVVVGADGRPVGAASIDPSGNGTDGEGDDNDPARLVEQPAKVMRIGSMIKQLLEEVRAAPLDEAGRQRLKEIHARSIGELEDGLAPELRDELERLSLRVCRVPRAHRRSQHRTPGRTPGSTSSARRRA